MKDFEMIIIISCMKVDKSYINRNVVDKERNTFVKAGPSRISAKDKENLGKYKRIFFQPMRSIYDLIILYVIEIVSNLESF